MSRFDAATSGIDLIRFGGGAGAGADIEDSENLRG